MYLHLCIEHEYVELPIVDVLNLVLGTLFACIHTVYICDSGTLQHIATVRFFSARPPVSFGSNELMRTKIDKRNGYCRRAPRGVPA